MTDEEWSDLEQEWHDERIVRHYLARTLEIAHQAAEVAARDERARRDVRLNAAAAIARADKAAEESHERCARMQSFAEDQVREYGPLIGTPCPTPRPEPSVVRS